MADKSGSSDQPRWDPSWNADLESYKEQLVTRARFKGTYRGSPDLLELVESAESYAEAFSPAEWASTAAQYPDHPLVKGQLTKTPHEDCPARAFHLAKAIDRLLWLARAPEAMRADIALLLGTYTPRGALKSAKIQELMIEEIGAPIAKIADKAEAKRPTVHALVENRTVIRPLKTFK